MGIAPWQFRVRHLLLLVGLTAAVLFLAKEMLFPPREPMGKGSPEFARTWKAAFEGIETPEAARSRHPEAFVKQFANGTWLFGVLRGSHGDPEGGTIVLKDNTGKVRAFFGHVCNPRPEWLAEGISDPDPASFCGALLGTGRFTEYPYP